MSSSISLFLCALLIVRASDWFRFFGLSCLLLLTPVLCWGDKSVAKENWLLVWSDEFSGVAGALDHSKWGYEEGFLRNEEMQYYTQSNNNIFLHEGKLTIRAQLENIKNKDYWPEAPDGSAWVMTRPAANFTSGSITTQGKFDFTYGRMDVRAQLPSGKGVWPAIWLLGSNVDKQGWPASGEIDVMEHIGRLSNAVHASLHYKGEKEAHKMELESVVLEPMAEGFHLYSLIWNENEIRMMVDGRVYFHREFNELETFYRGDNPFLKPFFLKINLALGGEWAGLVDNGIFPQDFVIDYVRVFNQATVERSRF